MAKRKTPKTVDLKPQAEKITEDQLTRVQALIKATNQGRNELGSIEVQKHNILHEIDQIQAEIAKFQKELQSEYGTSDLNIATGELTYKKEDEQVNS